MFESITCFPLTRNCIKKGCDRYYEPIDFDEEVGYCGPPDRPCIDCYICLSPICIPFDILSCFQCYKSKSNIENENNQYVFNIHDDSLQEDSSQVEYNYSQISEV